MAYPAKITPALRKKFLDTLDENGGIVAHAAQQVGVSRQQLYLFRDEHAKFRTQWEGAVRRGSELLEDTARMRAIHGVKEDIYHGGVKVGTVTRYSDYLLWRFLQGHRPDKYRERVEGSGPDGQVLQPVVIHLPDNGRGSNK